MGLLALSCSLFTEKSENRYFMGVNRWYVLGTISRFAFFVISFLPFFLFSHPAVYFIPSFTQTFPLIQLRSGERYKLLAGPCEVRRPNWIHLMPESDWVSLIFGVTLSRLLFRFCYMTSTCSTAPWYSKMYFISSLFIFCRRIRPP